MARREGARGRVFVALRAAAKFKSRLATPNDPQSNLRVDVASVIDEVIRLKVGGSSVGSWPGLNPNAVFVVFDSFEGRANTLLPQFNDFGYGIVKIRRGMSERTSAHELAHAIAGWLDEYVEDDLADTDVGLIDLLTFATSFSDPQLQRAKDFWTDAENPFYPVSLTDMFVQGRTTCPSGAAPPWWARLRARARTRRKAARSSVAACSANRVTT